MATIFDAATSADELSAILGEVYQPEVISVTRELAKVYQPEVARVISELAKVHQAPIATSLGKVFGPLLTDFAYARRPRI